MMINTKAVVIHCSRPEISDALVKVRINFGLLAYIGLLLHYFIDTRKLEE